jgi:hypothetical protein
MGEEEEENYSKAEFPFPIVGVWPTPSGSEADELPDLHLVPRRVEQDEQDELDFFDS